MAGAGYLVADAIVFLVFMAAWQCIGFVFYLGWLLYVGGRAKPASWGTLVWSLILLVVCFWPIGLWQYWQWEHERQNQARLKENEAHEAAWAASEQAAAPQIAASAARFQELCQEEDETIFRTAENVEGVFLMNPLKDYDISDMYDQWQDGPVDNHIDRLGWTDSFSYVDIMDAEDGKRYRYARIQVMWRYPDGKISGEGHGPLPHRVEVTPDMPKPRYGVIWKDITKREDRERFWIAGGELKVVDLENGETMARRVRYIMAPWGRLWEGKTPVFNQRHDWRDARSDGRCPGVTYLGSEAFARKALKAAPFVTPVQVKDKPVKQ